MKYSLIFQWSTPVLRFVTEHDALEKKKKKKSDHFFQFKIH